ncbi:MAG: hypothetical protein IJQ26_05970 [Lachnospiraceae bacterium]|nr:hypothetical protein [Lachnospiraceae bacterium]
MNIGSMQNVTAMTAQLNAGMVQRKAGIADFAGALNEASGETKVDAYKNALETKFGVPMIIASVGGDQSSMDGIGAATSGTGNVVIAPNILEQMANDPEKAAKYEKMIQEHFDSLPQTEAFMASIGHKITSCGVVIHPDGTAHYYLSGEEGPEIKAKFEAEQKAKREKKIEERREAGKRAEERAREHAIQMERVFHRQNVEEAMLALQMQGVGRYYSGISDIPSSLPLSYATSIAPGIMARMNGFR